MKSKIVKSLMIASCLGLLVATVVAQTVSVSNGSQEASSTTTVNRAPLPLNQSVGVARFKTSGGAPAVYSNRVYRTYAEEDSSAVDQLVEQLKEAKADGDKEKIKTQLKALLDTEFAARQTRHEREIADLEGKVKKLKELFVKRQENGREIVANRLDQILRDAQGLGW